MYIKTIFLIFFKRNIFNLFKIYIFFKFPAKNLNFKFLSIVEVHYGVLFLCKMKMMMLSLLLSYYRVMKQQLCSLVYFIVEFFSSFYSVNKRKINKKGSLFKAIVVCLAGWLFSWLFGWLDD